MSKGHSARYYDILSDIEGWSDKLNALMNSNEDESEAITDATEHIDQLMKELETVA